MSDNLTYLSGIGHVLCACGCWIQVRFAGVWSGVILGVRSTQRIVSCKHNLGASHFEYFVLPAYRRNYHSKDKTALTVYRDCLYQESQHLCFWVRVTHICVGNLTIVGSDNGLSPVWRQAIFWTNAGIYLIGILQTCFSEILIAIQTFSFKRMHLKNVVCEMAETRQARRGRDPACLPCITSMCRCSHARRAYESNGLSQPAVWAWFVIYHNCIICCINL